MSYSNPIPTEVTFETKYNSITKPYIRKAFLSSLLLCKDDILHGYIEINNTKYCLYLTEELHNALILLSNTVRLSVLASFQIHTNEASIVLCKLFLPTNTKSKHSQSYIKTFRLNTTQY